jgi:hypothetical protein
MQPNVCGWVMLREIPRGGFDFLAGEIDSSRVNASQHGGTLAARTRRIHDMVNPTVGRLFPFTFVCQYSTIRIYYI